jgi:hypothetical protein
VIFLMLGFFPMIITESEGLCILRYVNEHTAFQVKKSSHRNGKNMLSFLCTKYNSDCKSYKESHSC